MDTYAWLCILVLIWYLNEVWFLYRKESSTRYQNQYQYESLSGICISFCGTLDGITSIVRDENY